MLTMMWYYQDILTRSFASRFKLCFAPPDYRTLIRQLVGYFPRKGQKLLRFVFRKKGVKLVSHFRKVILIYTRACQRDFLCSCASGLTSLNTHVRV